MMRHGLPPTCPGCGQIDSVQRVRGLVASRNDVAANVMRAPQPPPPPVRPGINPWLVFAGIWFVVGIIIFAANAGHDRSGAAALFGWMLALGVPAAYVVYHVGGSHRRALSQQLKVEDHQARLEDYGRALAIWDQLEFCHRCNTVFLPGNEWQYEVNQSRDPIGPHNAWWYATQLAWYRYNRERAVAAQPG